MKRSYEETLDVIFGGMYIQKAGSLEDMAT
jgi:hypothetical protein